ncbi:hepatocyte growth factor-regulated tyrosine kinase substrate-like isoform X3 [Ornithodoros turicata]|uniref:hepatocyte growth factor-regulated tyrosine kinase substrate-like isoform X3 n=1 Tax=Ornithodoros turicata TaxID=34597 RepID=UPI003139E1CD
MFSWSSATFDKLLDKATSHLLLEPDWPSILQICDCIRQGDVQPKYAISAVKKRLYTRNPHVTLFALQVLESCVKNCGAPVHNEIATKQFMEELRDLVKANTNEAVRDKVLELLQAWAHAFRNDPNYRSVQDTLNLMKVEGIDDAADLTKIQRKGYKFPPLKESDAMFSADQAPDWADGECCHRCRVQFSLVQRKHHCRNCGQIFCQKCSSQAAPIPRYGIEKEVRVCEACFEKLSSVTKSPRSSQKSTEESSPVHQTNSSAPPGKSEQELQEEEELQLALALSKSEAETKQRPVSWQPPSTQSTVNPSSQQEKPSTERKSENSATESDPELAHYLNRSYWEQRQQGQDSPGGTPSVNNRQSPVPSAPATAVSYSPKHAQQPTQGISIPIKGASDAAGGDTELDEFTGQLQSTLEVFVNRLQSNAVRGRHVSNDSYVQSLFLSLSSMHSKLLHYIQEMDQKREYYEGLQDKLSQIRDARAALDALREEHNEQLRRQAEEADRQRQIQMAHKLHIMREKKREYLQYQHQLALQKMQEQEREMQMRQEMHKQQYYMGYGQPQGPLPPGMPPQGMPQQGGPPHGMPQQGVPPQGMPQQGVPPQGMPQQGVPPQGMPPQSMPQQGIPLQGMHPHGIPPQGLPPQGMPPHGMTTQGLPTQALQHQSVGPQSMVSHTMPPHSMAPQPVPPCSMPPQTMAPQFMPPPSMALPSMPPQALQQQTVSPPKTSPPHGHPQNLGQPAGQLYGGVPPQGIRFPNDFHPYLVHGAMGPQPQNGPQHGLPTGTEHNQVPMAPPEPALISFD